MLIDKDLNGNISITEIPTDVAEYMADAFICYFAPKTNIPKTDAERQLILLARQLEMQIDRTPLTKVS